jgi:hypothetical protein
MGMPPYGTGAAAIESMIKFVVYSIILISITIYFAIRYGLYPAFESMREQTTAYRICLAEKSKSLPDNYSFDRIVAICQEEIKEQFNDQ